MAGNYKFIARYQHIASGLGWTLTGVKNVAGPANIKTAFDTWNTLYLDCCPAGVKLVDLRVSNVLIWGDSVVYPADEFADQIGTKAGNVMPLAECVLLKGSSVTIGNEGRSVWRLHGLSAGCFNADGSVNTLDAQVALLAFGSNGLWFQYRPVASPVKALPVVDPPVAYETYQIEGPYVRRLGSPFFLPGQRARYSRS